jgi:hypothetical protein
MATDLQGTGYRARVIQDLPAPNASNENADVFVTLDDGSTYNGVIATTRNIAYLFEKFAAEGQCAHGAYLWISHLVILRDFAPNTIQIAIDGLVSSGEIRQIFAASR